MDNLNNNNFFAVVDIETTGFSPKYNHKIIEIAIITLDHNGNEIDYYETLINPKRDVGPTHLHGISAEMVKHAPLIEDVIGDICKHIQNKTIIGHNLQFDLRFINYELEKHLNLSRELIGLCTLQLSKIVEPNLPIRKLENLCNYYDIENKNSHSAFGDCQATSKLFCKLKEQFLEQFSNYEFQRFINPVNINLTFKSSDICFKRQNALEVQKKESNILSSYFNRLSSNPNDEIPVQQYLNLLDEILADRIITQNELESLSELATENNISQSQASEIHQEYVRKLTRIYLIDDLLTENEFKDLNKVADLLCVSNEILCKIIKYEKATIQKHAFVVDTQNFVGKSVCFTGQLISKLNGKIIDRTMAQQMAIEKGMIIKNSVVKNLDYLVAADTNSLSGKAEKARDYNVKILAEPVFWNLLGISIE